MADEAPANFSYEQNGAMDTSQPQLPLISTFWHGPHLPLWANLCLKSFADRGHEVRVFTYGPEPVLPPGARREPAESILPESDIFFYREGVGRGSVAGFANVFRYALLYEQGGYWVDADVLCKKPFPKFERAAVGRQDQARCNNAVIYAPPGDQMMREALSRARSIGKNATWGEAGPRLLSRLVGSGEFDVEVLGEAAFYPVPFEKVITKLLLPETRNETINVCEKSYGVHLFNEIFRRAAIDTSRMPPRGSYLEREFTSILGEKSEIGYLRPHEVRVAAAKFFIKSKAHGAARRLRKSFRHFQR